ncbi:MAG: hypothetical protein ACKVYV_07615 [Limisphaerales bacterium]
MQKPPWISFQIIWGTLLFMFASRAGAGTFAWKNPPVSGDFNVAGNWQNSDGGGGFPGAGDFAIFRDGVYTVTCDGATAGMTELIGTVTFQLNGNYSAGSYIQGGNPVVLQGGGTLQTGPFSSIGEGSILVNGSGLTMDSFDFGTTFLQTRIRGINGAKITSSGRSSILPQPRLESSSEWRHTGALNADRCFISGGSLLAADELTVRAELDAGRLQAGLLKGGGQAINGSTVTAVTASLSDWLLEGSGNSMNVSGTTLPGLVFADVSIKAGATFSAGALADNAWYTVDGSGSQLTVAGLITSDGPQKITIQKLGQGSSASLSKAFVIVRDAGSLFSFADKAEDSTVQIQNGGRINGVNFIGPSAPTNTAGGSISGAGSALVLSGDLDLGRFRESSVTVDAGGRLECFKGTLDGGKVGGFSSGSVFGVDSFWLARNGLAVGKTKGVATLNLGGGGRVEVRGPETAMALGLESGSEGRMDVDGGSLPVPSALDTRQTAETGVGVGGRGSLSVRSQGRILASKLTVGVRAGSEGTLDVIGAGTSLEGGDTLEIGRLGSGRMTIFAGGLATAPDVLVGSNNGTNLLRLTGAGSRLKVGNDMHVGEAGAGRLSIEQGSRVEMPGALANDTGFAYLAFQSGSTGLATVSGAGSAWVGERGVLTVGTRGVGTLNVTNGGEVNFEQIAVGSGAPGASGVATIAGAGSVMRTLNYVSIGGITKSSTGPGEISVTSGGQLRAGFNLDVFKPATLRLNGGSATVGQVSEAAILGTVIVGNQGKFRLGGKLMGSVLLRQGGVFLPGSSPGKATIEGDLTLSTDSSLELELGGTDAGAGYDQIEATGAVALAGHLEIVFRDGFAPTNGQVFELVKGGAVLGSFSTVAVSGLAPGFTYSLTIPGGNRLLLAATSAGVATTQPELAIVRSGGPTVVVSWPDYITGWTLQKAGELPALSWTPVTTSSNTVTLPASLDTSFFRLISP